MIVPIASAALKLLLHAFAITHYGYFRDELYYIACSKHLAWGYVDHPPLSIALLALARATLGDSLWAIRLLPALAGAGTVFLVGLLVRELGGGRFAQALACLAAVIPPVWLAVDHFFSMNAFDTFFWTLAAWLLLRAIANGRPRTWILFGIAVGLGLLNKWSMAWFSGGAFFGLLLTPERRVLRTPWPWVAAVISAVIVMPNLIWEQMHAWPTLEFMRNAAREKMVRTGFGEFWKQQVLVMNPVNVLLWVPGLIFLLRSARARVIGIAYLATAALLVTSGSSRPNYLAVADAPLLAAGAVAVGRAAASRAWIRPVALMVLVLLGAPVALMGLPLLPVDRQIAYMRPLSGGVKAQERSSESDLPQVFADMFGWEEMVQRVARVYHALPEPDRQRCVIAASNYGEAGAIDFFGPRYGLPSAISWHNNYWLWGTHGGTGDVMILVGGDRDDAHNDFRSATLADTTSCNHCMPYENGAPIWVLHGLNMPLSERWKQIRRYI